MTAPYAPVYTPGAHRYWRVTARTGGNGAYYGVAEIQMRETSGGADVTSTGFAIFSNERTGFEATKAFDDIISGNNCWSVVDTPGEWVGQDFGVSNDKEIVEVVMSSRADSFFSQMVQAFDLEYSDDNVSWTVAAKFYGVLPYAQNETRTFTADYA